MTQTIGAAFREAVLALPSNLSPEKRPAAIAKIFDQLTNNGNENIDLNNADLSKLNLQQADFSEADLSEANLRGTDLRDASFRDTNLNNAQMDDHTQLSGTTGLLEGREDESGKRQNNTINITPNVQFPDDVVEAFREAIKTNANFWNEYTYEDNMAEVTINQLTLKLPAQALEAFKTSIQNQIKNLFISKVKSIGYIREYTGTEFNPSEPDELADSHRERKNTLNAMIEELRGEDGIFDLSRTNLTGLNLSDLDLHDTNFTGCNLSGTDLRGSNLEGADLTDAIIDDQTQWPQDYSSSGHARD